MMRTKTEGEVKLSLLRFAMLIIALTIVLLCVGLSASSAKLETVDQYVIHLPLIDKQSLWSDECIDCPHNFWDRSLDGAQLDSNGRIHVAYGGKRLYYAFQDDSGQWVKQVVDETPWTGTKASLGMDSSDRPHILYCNWGNDTWKYAFQAESGWQFEIFNVPCDLATIVVDSQDRPHIAYRSLVAQDQELRYGYRDVDGWHFDVIDSNLSDLWLAYNLSLALDSLDHPHIVYNFSSQELRYAVYDGTDWSIMTIGEPGRRHSGTSIVLDSSDSPHISYVQGISNLKYAFKNGSNWQIETAATPSEGFFQESSLKLDQSGTPYVLVTEFDAYCIRATTCYDMIFLEHREGDGNWIEGWFMDTARNGTLLINDSDGIHGVAEDTTYPYPELQLHSLDSGSSTIDRSQRGVHGAMNLVIDQNDKLHSTYAKYTGFSWIEHYDSVDYASIENSNWHIETVGFRTHSGAGNQLSAGPTDAVAIVYPGLLPYPPYESRYFLSRRTESGWNRSPIPWKMEKAISIDTAIDSQGFVHFSWLDSNGLYYWFDPTSGMSSPEFVNIGPGESLAMVIGASNQPCIAYHVYGTGLKYACRNGIEWTKEVVRAVDSYSISLELDSVRQPHIVYIQGLEGSGEIKHASLISGDWHVEPVSWINGDLSMTIDGQDFIHLSYWDGAKDIIHAYRNDTGWIFGKVMTSGNAPRLTAVAVDSQGNPHIAYIDNELNDLRIISYQSH